MDLTDNTVMQKKRMPVRTAECHTDFSVESTCIRHQNMRQFCLYLNMYLKIVKNDQIILQMLLIIVMSVVLNQFQLLGRFHQSEPNVFSKVMVQTFKVFSDFNTDYYSKKYAHLFRYLKCVHTNKTYHKRALKNTHKTYKVNEC